MKKLFVVIMSILSIALFAGHSFGGEAVIDDSAFTAKQLLGLEVTDTGGNHVGYIRDVKLNADTEEINYFVLGKSLLGIAEDTTAAVPPEALKIQNAEGRITATLIVSELRMLGAPVITYGESTEDFKSRLHEYYCASPEFGEGAEGLKQC